MLATKKNVNISNRFELQRTDNLIVSSQTVTKSKSTKRVRDNSPIWNPLSQQIAKRKPGRPPKVGSALQFQ